MSWGTVEPAFVTNSLYLSASHIQAIHNVKRLAQETAVVCWSTYTYNLLIVESYIICLQCLIYVITPVILLECGVGTCITGIMCLYLPYTNTYMIICMLRKTWYTQYECLQTATSPLSTVIERICYRIWRKCLHSIFPTFNLQLQ